MSSENQTSNEVVEDTQEDWVMDSGGGMAESLTGFLVPILLMAILSLCLQNCSTGNPSGPDREPQAVRLSDTLTIQDIPGEGK